jgi:hypothetical protein
MSRFEADFEALQTEVAGRADFRVLPSGARLITVKAQPLPAGWSQTHVDILFVAPPAFPAAQPDCFWVLPGGLRLASGTTPQNTNDANPIPEVGPSGTWFSWHLQDWNPNRDSLVSYFRVVLNRLHPPR